MEPINAAAGGTALSYRQAGKASMGTLMRGTHCSILSTVHPSLIASVEAPDYNPSSCCFAAEVFSPVTFLAL